MRKRWIQLTSGLFLLDLAVKNEIEAHDELEQEQELIPGRVSLLRLHNHGTAGGRLIGHMDQIIRVSAVMTWGLLLADLALLAQKGQRVLKCGMAFMTGGALCNLYDRCKRGYVVDYLCFHAPWRWLSNLVFNLSDLFVFLGAALICLSAGKETDKA